MAGMDWFRWHHGCVTDPKFQLVAKKAGASVAEVIAVWACLLEAASQADDRGNPGESDAEAMDCALGLAEGKTVAIMEQMVKRGLRDPAGRLTAWDRRQPKREREDATNADRQRTFRAKQNQVTPDNATDNQKTPREEKSREEEKETPSGGELAGFAKFWAAWPTSDRKQARGKCLDAWKKAKAEADAALVVGHVERMKTGPWTKDNGQYIPAPLTYLNQRRWEGADSASNDDPYGLKGAI